jgi:ABC-type dipeptide/oligopeptide/nickel transport systems, permease components
VRTFATKLLRLVVVIIAVTFFSFSLIKLVPGDPATYIINFDPSGTLKANCTRICTSTIRSSCSTGTG